VILLISHHPRLTFPVPWYIFFARLRLIDTYAAMILSHLLVGLPLIAWIAIPSFEALPKVSRITGASTAAAISGLLVHRAPPEAAGDRHGGAARLLFMEQLHVRGTFGYHTRR
jgi:ABC-type maltose transport system permease subunit